MNVKFTPHGWEDFQHWIRINDKRKIKRISDLIQNIQASPFEGLGKPEALRFSLTDCWSRRIDDEHRLVYRIHEDDLIILQCRYHY